MIIINSFSRTSMDKMRKINFIILALILLVFSMPLVSSIEITGKAVETTAPASPTSNFDLGPDCALSMAGTVAPALSGSLNALSWVLSVDPNAPLPDQALNFVKGVPLPGLPIIPFIGGISFGTIEALPKLLGITGVTQTIKKEVYKAGIQGIAKSASPELATAIDSCTKIREKVLMPEKEKGMKINVDEKGNIKTELHITTKTKDTNLGIELGYKNEKDVTASEDVKVDAKNNIFKFDFEKEGTVKIENILIVANKGAQATFDKEKGLLSLSQGDVKIADRSYANIKDAVFKVDGKGNVLEAELISTKDNSVYVFGKNQPLTVPADTKVTYKNGIVTVEGAGKEFSYGKNQIRNLGPSAEIKANTIYGVFKINELDKVVGTIDLLKEGYSIYDSTTVETNGIRIDVPVYQKNLFLSFTGKEYSENFISLDLKNKKLIANAISDGNFEFGFKEGNPFLPVEKGDLLAFRTFFDGGEISIQNRDKEGLIPEVEITINKGGLISEANGPFYFDFVKGEEFKVKPLGFEQNTVPMTVVVYNSEGKNILGTEKEPKKLIISNFNEFSTIPLRETEGIVEEPDFAPGKISERLYFNYQQYGKKEFKEAFPNIELVGELDSPSVKRTIDNIKRLPPKVKNSIKAIELLSEKTFAARFPDNSGEALALEEGIVMKKTKMYEPFFYHEGAHMLTHRYNTNPEVEENKEVVQYVLKNVKELASKNKISIKLDEKDVFLSDVSSGVPFINVFPKFEKEGDKEKFFSLWAEGKVKPILTEAGKIREEKSFVGQWKRIAGDVYGVDPISKEKIPGITFFSWADGSQTPLNGVIRPYGATNWNEDISTFVEKVYTGPDFYIPLIDPKNSAYDKRYLLKLELLDKHGYLPEGWLNGVKSKIK